MIINTTQRVTSQAIGLPNEGYTYDAIGNRLGSRHQPGSWQYNGQDQLMSWGTGSHYTSTSFMKLSIQNYIHGYYSQIRSYQYNDGLSPNQREALLAKTSIIVSEIS